MALVYQTTVTGIGELATAFFSEKMIILFKDNVPEELADYCILHSGNTMYGSVQAGDWLRIGDKEYRIVFVGDEVEQNLSNLGHITLRFDGQTDGLGGSVYLEDRELPQLRVGDCISIERK